MLTLRTALPSPKYDSVAARHGFYDRVLGEIRELPGVSQASYVTGLPLVMRASAWVVRVPGYDELPSQQRVATLRFVTPGFFDSLGIPLRAGRAVAESDTLTSSPAVVVSESFVRQYWPGQDADRPAVQIARSRLDDRRRRWRHPRAWTRAGERASDVCVLPADRRTAR